MRKLSLLFVFAFAALSLAAQKKSLSYDQAFKNNSFDLLKQLPSQVQWVDDEHYTVYSRNAEGSWNWQVVEAKTGKTVPNMHPPEQETMIRPGDRQPASEKRNVTVSPDGKQSVYTKKDNNLYIENLSTHDERQLTTDGSQTVLNGYASWVYYEEILGRASRYRAFWWSPDSKHLSFMRFDESQVPVFPIYWADGQHGWLENQRYPEAGDKNPEVKIGVISVADDKTVWADFNAADDQYFGKPYWTPSGQLWVQWMNRGQNNLKFYNIDLAGGAKTEVYDEKQPTWIDLDDDNRVDFLESGKGFILKSDKTGWRQLYLYDMSGKLVNAIANGDYTVGTIYKIDEKAKLVYFNARKENSARWDLYSASLDGKKLNRLSTGDYSWTGMSLSPGNSYFISTYSNISTPSTEVVMDMKGKIVREISNVKGASFDAYALPKKELVRVKSADGLFDLPVLITYPVNFDPNKKYPVLVSIYGGPNAGTVYDQWHLTPAEIWWAQEGLVQVAFDNRSSGHFGKKGMNYIYHQLGKYEIEDFMDCGRWLKKQSWVNGSKLCITGGSFGGYMTCMALTYGADVFDYGYANSSVTDWQLYDTHYTERYMGRPSDNPDGYKKTAVLTYADKYKGLLHIIHGTSDDNVHMQNTMQFINKLEDMKKYFELMIYPGERHGISGAKGLYNRTEAAAFYYKYLLNKEMPGDFWK
ncbi:MAG TPA: DPP IV N-terminal domain-containing protein [Chitinophagaceae bacterium]|jgi:dipeptidyl-peptidase-4